jgi:hypothetical protein
MAELENNLSQSFEKDESEKCLSVGVRRKGCAMSGMSWIDGHGNEVTQEVNQVIDVRDFLGTPGYLLLVVAANTNLSISDIERFLHLQGREVDGVERSPSWIQRRRWLFQKPGADNTKGPRPNGDRNEARALKIIRERPTVSLRSLAVLLRERGIARSREWVRKHRCGKPE